MKLIKLILKAGRRVSWILDITMLPVSVISFLWFRIVKFIGIRKFPITTLLTRVLGVLPIVDHYYEPKFKYTNSEWESINDRDLPGISMNTELQLEWLAKFSYADELRSFGTDPSKREPHFYYHNGSFPSGDAEFYYSIIRHIKPKRIIEVGSGFSTLIALEAVQANNIDGNDCKMICIEPYENKWLRSKNVQLVESKVEELALDMFNELEEFDILFIDSSHIIRPGGDVTTEILKILPSLKRVFLFTFMTFSHPEIILRNG